VDPLLHAGGPARAVPAGPTVQRGMIKSKPALDNDNTAAIAVARSKSLKTIFKINLYYSLALCLNRNIML